MKKVCFNKNWNFHKGGGSSLEGLMIGENAAVSVTLPHDASIGMDRNPDERCGSGNGFFREECCFYTKNFSLNPSDDGKNVWIEFEGIYQNAFIYVNGSYAGKCPYGYSNFYLDITRLVNFYTSNSVKVIVKNGVPSGRWYTGGGIYRNVNIMVADRLHFEPDGIRITTMELEDDQAVIRVRSHVTYTGIGVQDTTLEVQLYDPKGRKVASDVIPVTIDEHSTQVYQQKLYIQNPMAWDVDHPVLYSYHAIIKVGDEIHDEEMGTFGIRKLQLNRVHGLRVNGKVVKLKGGCIHHDNGIIGTAEFPHAAEFRVQRMKEAGYNAIRSSHNPMSRQLLEACDKLGMYVMDEYSDVWTTTKIDFDYGMNVTEWWKHDIDHMVRKDYNHPCVIMYSIGNEIPETGNKFDTQWGKKFADRFRELDDSRYVTNSINLMLSVMDHIPEFIKQNQEGEQELPENQEINSMMNSVMDIMDMLNVSDFAGKAIEESAAQVDMIGYNYGAARYEMDGVNYPNRIIFGSETYPKDLDINWELVEKYPYVLGDFAWTAWDYLGETGIGRITYGENQNPVIYTPYPYKAAYCGDMNLIGDRRPVSYWRETIWGGRDKPYLAVQIPAYHGMVHNIPRWSMTDAVRSWNWKDAIGKEITIEVYTDADEAELFVNDISVERKTVGEKKKNIAYFETVYIPGVVEAVVYKNGEECGRDRIETADDVLCIRAVCDREQIPADESDIAFVDISLVDVMGRLNPEAVTEVSISVEGPGLIIGFGSADPESEENYFDRSARAYEGRLRAAVRGTGEKGTIKVTMETSDCAPVSVTLVAE